MVDVPLFSVLLSLTVLHFSVSMSLFYKRHNTFPIRGHAMGLVFLNMSALLADGVQTMIAGMLASSGSFYCALPVFIKLPAIYVYALAYLARVWRIWFKYRYSNEKVQAEHHRVKQIEEASRSSATVVVATDKMAQWFYEKRRYFGKKSLRRMVIIGAAVLWLLPLTLYFVGGSTFSDLETAQLSCDAQNPLPSFISFAIIGGFILTIAYTAYCSRNIYDGYCIKREIVVVLVWGIIGVALSVLQPFITLFVYRVLWFVVINVFLGACLTWKVYISYRNEREVYLRATRKRGRSHTVSRVSRASGSVSKSTNLRSCMNNEFSMAMFMEHLKREFSVENILFYQAVQRFRKACTGDEITGPYLHGTARNRLAAEIYARFVDENGELQVNLSAIHGRAVLDTLGECIPGYSPADYQHTYYSETLATPPAPGTGSLSPAGGVPKRIVPQASESPSVVPADIFNDCQKEIFNLMEKDSFVRFKLMLSHDATAEAAAKFGKSSANSSGVTQV